jgi:cellulose synthase (UDP-forming)
VTDYVGLTILGDPTWDASFGLPVQSFSDLLRSRYAVVQGVGKPVIIAELGVSGAIDRQKVWLAKAVQVIPDFPLVRAVVYFDAVNAPNNHLPTEPDWRVPTDLMRTFSQAITTASAGSRFPHLGSGPR